MSFSGDIIITPTPPSPITDEPSKQAVQYSASWSGSGRVNYAMKSAKACALIAVLGLYLMSNWLSSTAHWTIQPAASGLLIAFQIG